MVKKKTNKKLLGYCRCSVIEQATEGLSLAVQKSKILSYCNLNDLELIDIVEDAGISGKSLSRPGLQSLIHRLKNGDAGGLIILKLDRVSRSTRDVISLTEMIEEHGWELHSISERLDTSTASGRFVITILSALAQMEREQIGERTSMALQYKKSNGERLGTTPFGYETVEASDGKRELQPLDLEQTTLKEIIKMRDGGRSYQEIAATLNEQNIPTKRGAKWHGSTVHYLIQKVIPQRLFV